MRQDLRYAVRQLGKHPGFTAAAALTLALGIGANTLVWSVVDGVVMRPLPYEEPDRLVRIFETAPGRPDELLSIAHPTLDAWADLRAFESVALYGPWSLDLAGDGRPEQLQGAAVSKQFLETLRARPSRGRPFTVEEHQPGGPKVIILGDRLWRRRFAADPAIVGRILALDGNQFEVIGVMPPGFAYPADAEYWVTTGLDHEYGERRARHLSAIGRLRPELDVTAARADLLRIQSGLAEQYPDAYEGVGIQVVPLHERIVGRVRAPLLFVLAAVGAVLLIACANVANLTLARTAGRLHEFAVRAALGASAGRVTRLVVLENLLLAVLGGSAGVLAAYLTLDVLRGFLADQLPRIAEVSLDIRVIGFALVATLLTALLVGLAPAVQVRAPNVSSHLQRGGRSLTTTRFHARLRGGLIVAQTATALVLLTGAGLLIKSFARLMAVDPGLHAGGVLTFQLGLQPARQADRTYVVEFYRRLRERLEAIPGVQSAGLASRLPLSGADHSNDFRLMDEAPGPGRDHSAQDRAVSPGYFRTMGIRVRGREFSDADTPESQPVVMVNESFAQRYFPGKDPVGEWFVPSRAGGVPRQIIGVAADTRQFGLDAPAEPEFYLPHTQDPWPWLSVVLRSTVDPVSLVRSAERAVWSLDPNLPLTAVRTMEDIKAESAAPRRLGFVLIGGFAALALGLAVIGTYGVMAYIVTERLPEVGVRLALGATPADVLHLVVGRGLRLAAVGVLLGLVGVAATGRLLQRLLFGVTAWDLPTLVAAAGLLGGAVLLASYLPSRRAARVDPVRALRGE